MSRDWGSNPGPCPYHGHALPTELSRHEGRSIFYMEKEEEGRFLLVRTEDDSLGLGVDLVNQR